MAPKHRLKVCNRVHCALLFRMLSFFEFLELDNVSGCFGRGIHFPNQIFCPIEKILIFREMRVQKVALGEKIVAISWYLIF